MVRLFLMVALATCPLAANAAMPYDAVARVSPPGKTWGGSGVLIYKTDGKGLVVTNAHVACGRDTFDIVWPSGTRCGKVVAYLPDADLAFLVVEDPPIEAAKMGIRDSHIVFAGYPHYDREKLHWQYGNVVAEDFSATKWRNMPVPGMSGGAVFDRADGDLCGLIRAAHEGYGYGVSDLVLIVMASKYEKPETWVPNGKACVEDKKDWKFAKPSKTVITKDIEDEEPPTWEDEDDSLHK